MNDKLFLKIYLPALEKALANDDVDEGYDVLLPMDYIEDQTILSEIEKYEKEHYDKFYLFFELVYGYFDAKAHCFESVGQYTVAEYREKLVKSLEMYKVILTIPDNPEE